MEIQQVNKTEFAEMLKSAGNETHQTTFENDVWYEQVTVEEVTYRHKLLALRKLSSELLNKKAFESKPRIEPLRLRAQGNGPVVALVFTTNGVLPPCSQLKERNGPGQEPRELLCQKPPPQDGQAAAGSPIGFLRGMKELISKFKK